MKQQSNLLKQFQVWMEQKGYKKTTQSNLPSTISDYKSSFLRICAWESKTPEQIAESISTILPQYTIGEHSARGRMKSRAVRSSIRAFSKFLIETQVA
jgi:hypothetical protein